MVAWTTKLKSVHRRQPLKTDKYWERFNNEVIGQITGLISLSRSAAVKLLPQMNDENVILIALESRQKQKPVHCKPTCKTSIVIGIC